MKEIALSFLQKLFYILLVTCLTQPFHFQRRIRLDYFLKFKFETSIELDWSTNEHKKISSQPPNLLLNKNKKEKSTQIPKHSDPRKSFKNRLSIRHLRNHRKGIKKEKKSLQE